MKKYCLTVLVLITGACYSFAQNESPCPCCSDDHKAFDFWVGDWTVITMGEESSEQIRLLK
jgi:hypothetical protein